MQRAAATAEVLAQQDGLVTLELEKQTRRQPELRQLERGLLDPHAEDLRKALDDEGRLVLDASEGAHVPDRAQDATGLAEIVDGGLELLVAHAALKPGGQIHEELQLRQVLLGAVEFLQLAAPRRERRVDRLAR